MKRIIKNSKQRLYKAVLNQWYHQPTWLYVLWPIALLAHMYAYLRLLLIKPSAPPTDKIRVVIGNLTVGGGGKTPMTQWLAQALMQKGYRVAIITKGYGRIQSSDAPLCINDSHRVEMVGDEPMMLWQALRCPIIVGNDRLRNDQLACSMPVDVILSDDGLHDVRFQYDVQIAVIKHGLGLGNGWMLPMGPLRQPKNTLSMVDLIVETGRVSGDMGAKLCYQGLVLKPLHPEARVPEVGAHVHVYTGLAMPEDFASSLRAYGYQVTLHAFSDHHPFTSADFSQADPKAHIILSAKDAVKCQAWADKRMVVATLQCQANEPLEAWCKQRFPAKPQPHTA